MKRPYLPALIILAVVVIVLVIWLTAPYSSSLTVVPTPTSTAPTATTTLPVYTLAEISQHSTASSCWLAIDGNVYDVTTFIPIHPGGKAILRGCGKDATSLFNSVSAHAENNALTTVAPKYLIGTLAQ